MPKIPERVGLDSGANVHAVLTEDGTKELFAVVDDYREIAQSQRELLQHLKRTVDICRMARIRRTNSSHLSVGGKSEAESNGYCHLAQRSRTYLRSERVSQSSPPHSPRNLNVGNDRSVLID